VVAVDCLSTWLDLDVKRRVKRNLANHRHADKFYPHASLTIHLQLAIAFEHEIVRFARKWCLAEPVELINEIRAIKEIFEAENQDDWISTIEMLANKYAID
jgi:uncharacterized membrane protein YccC